jgi:hypothetical protein
MGKSWVRNVDKKGTPQFVVRTQVALEPKVSRRLSNVQCVYFGAYNAGYINEKEQ